VVVTNNLWIWRFPPDTHFGEYDLNMNKFFKKLYGIALAILGFGGY
jgi:hypothetical protein